MKAIAADAQVSSEQLAAELLELWHHLTRGASQQLYGLIADLDISITQMKTLHALVGTQEVDRKGPLAIIDARRFDERARPDSVFFGRTAKGDVVAPLP